MRTREIKPKESRRLTFEWAYFARSKRRRAKSSSGFEREMWKRAEREDVELALKYRRAWQTRTTLTIDL